MTADALVDECDGTDRPADSYTIAELAEHTGVTVKQIDHWTRAGLLHPTARDRAVNGVPRRWPASEAEVCRRMAALVDVGLSVPLAHDVARHRGRGPYRVGGLALALTLDQHNQVATDTDRAILRAPARAHLAGALRALHAQATAAAELVTEVNALLPPVACTMLPAEPPGAWPLDMLLTAANLLTGPDLHGQ